MGERCSSCDTKERTQMICKDLLSMKIIKDSLKLVAGEEGLMRTVRWIYFADCMECLEDRENLLEWIHGGELIIVTNKLFMEDEDKLLELMRLFNQKTVAGFVINVEQTPESAKALADEMKMPVFEIGWDLKMVDLSQIICLALAEEVKNENSINQLFANILYETDLTETDIANRAELYGINLNRPHFALDFDIDHLTKWVREKNLPEERRKECRESLLGSIKSEFALAGLSRVVTMIQGDAVLVLMPAEVFDEEQLKKILSRIQQQFADSNGMTVSVGIGEVYYYIDEFAQSAFEAKQAVEILHFNSKENEIMFYRDIGIYFLITHIQDKKLLENYYLKMLGPLVNADRFSDGNLCETLEMYFQHNCNANEAAKALFIHRNTMRYRLEKIVKLIGRDLNNIDDCTELNLAFHIKKYVETLQG